MGALIETRSDTALAATARFVDDKYSFRTLGTALRLDSLDYAVMDPLAMAACFAST